MSLFADQNVDVPSAVRQPSYIGYDSDSCETEQLLPRYQDDEHGNPSNSKKQVAAASFFSTVVGSFYVYLLPVVVSLFAVVAIAVAASYYLVSPSPGDDRDPNPTQIALMLDPREGEEEIEAIEVIAFYYPGKETAWDKICQAGFLGNFWDVTKNGDSVFQVTARAKGAAAKETTTTHEFNNTEAAYQGLKCWDRAEEFSQATGGEAFELKKKLHHVDSTYAGFGSNFVGMMHVLLVKFAPGTKMAALLIKTEDSFLVEHNKTTARDTVWSNNQIGNGSNLLGLQLMLIRDLLNSNLNYKWTKWIAENAGSEYRIGKVQLANTGLKAWEDIKDTAPLQDGTGQPDQSRGNVTDYYDGKEKKLVKFAKQHPNKKEIGIFWKTVVLDATKKINAELLYRGKMTAKDYKEINDKLLEGGYINEDEYDRL